MANILICGAVPATGNLGVNALGTAFVSEYRKVKPNDRVFIQTLDGEIVENFIEDDFGEYSFTTLPIRPTKKIYRKDSVFRYKLGRFFRWTSSFSKVFDVIDCVVDVAGGDSFTDLYGVGRFDMINSVKDLCLIYDKKYICLPQTYGPFSTEETELRAKRYIQKSLGSWARDDHSYDILLDLAGEVHSARCHNGVDMAFLLPARAAQEKIDPTILNALNGETGVVGINVSGLIYNSPEDAKNRYNFLCDYQSLILEFLKKVLDETPFTVLLIPHVLVDPSSIESDFSACQDVVNKLEGNERILVQSSCLDECESKWLISQCKWFMGTRMHATIAGLSTCTPTCTVSYSDKAFGVFESCGLADQVFDPRHSSSDSILRSLMCSLNDFDSLSERLSRGIPQVMLRARSQIRDVADLIETI